MIKSRFCSKNDYDIKTMGPGLKTLTKILQTIHSIHWRPIGMVLVLVLEWCLHT